MIPNWFRMLAKRPARFCLRDRRRPRQLRSYIEQMEVRIVPSAASPTDFPAGSKVESFEGLTNTTNSPQSAETGYFVPGAQSAFIFASGVTLTQPIPNPEQPQGNDGGVVVGDFSQGSADFGLGENGAISSDSEPPRVPDGSAYLGRDNNASTPVDFTFPFDVSAVGAYVTDSGASDSGPNPITLRAFHDSNTTPLETQSISGQNVSLWTQKDPSTFLGIKDSGIRRVQFNGDLMVMDQLMWSYSTTTTITAPDVTYNADGQVTVTVSSDAGTPTGSVTLNVDSGSGGEGGGQTITQDLVSGSTTFRIPGLGARKYHLGASYSANGIFGASSATGTTLNVIPAPTMTSIDAPAVTYNANGSVTVTVTSAAGTPTGSVSLDVDGGSDNFEGGGQTLTQDLGEGGSATFTLPGLGAGPHSLDAVYFAQGNFDFSDATGILNVSPAPTLTTIDAPAVTYNADGSVKVTVSSGVATPSGSVTLDVDGGSDAVGGQTFTKDLDQGGSTTFIIPGLGAGDHTLNAFFAPQGNFDFSQKNATLHVNPASTQTGIAAPDVTFNANGLVTVTETSVAGIPGGSVSLNVDGGSDQGGQTLTQDLGQGGSTTFTVSGLGAGNHTLNAFFATQGNFGPNSATGTLHVLKATPFITWADPAAITFGTPLGALQLDATADVPGSFSYSPVAGAVLNAGSHQALTATFTPDDGADYTTASATVHIDVGQATPVITWADPAAITFGTPLSAAQLDASADVPGSFSYSPVASAVLNAGNHQALTATFTPDDGADYTTASATVHIDVGKATPVITWADPAAITFGTPLGAAQLDASADVPGSFSYSPVAGAVLNAGNHQALTATFTPDDGADYTTASATVHIDVGKATPVITWADPAAITFGTALSAAQLDASADVPGSFRYSPVAGAVLNAGSDQALTATFTPDDVANYATAKASATLNVNLALTETLVVASANSLISGQLVTFTATVSSLAPGAGTPSGTVTFLDGNETLGTGTVDASGHATFTTSTLGVGSHTITAVYGGDGNFYPGTSAAISPTVLQPVTLSIIPDTIYTNTGVSFIGDVAVLTDTDLTAQKDQFTATINWGDGTSSPGAILAKSPGVFLISGTHTYTDAGNHQFTVTVTGGGHTITSPEGTANSLTGNQILSADQSTSQPGSPVVSAQVNQVEATLVQSPSTGAVTKLFVATYNGNPQQAPSTGLAFYDVRVDNPAPGAVLQVTFTFTGTAQGPPTLQFFNPVSKAYEPVHGSLLIAPSTAGLGPNQVRVVFDDTSFPTIGQLNGTVFTVTAPTGVTSVPPPPIQQVGFTANPSGPVFAGATHVTFALAPSQDTHLTANQATVRGLRDKTQDDGDWPSLAAADEAAYLWYSSDGEAFWKWMEEYLGVQKATTDGDPSGMPGDGSQGLDPLPSVPMVDEASYLWFSQDDGAFWKWMEEVEVDGSQGQPPAPQASSTQAPKPSAGQQHSSPDLPSAPFPGLGHHAGLPRDGQVGNLGLISPHEDNRFLVSDLVLASLLLNAVPQEAPARKPRKHFPGPERDKEYRPQ